MHVVYLVAEQQTPYWDQLRYSIRAIERNLIGLDGITVVGACPPWLRGHVQHLPTVQDGDRSRNVARGIKTIIDSQDLPNCITLLDCDMFPLHPTRPRIVGADAEKLLAWAKRERSPGDPRRDELISQAAILRTWGVPLKASMDDHNPHVIYRKLLGSVLRDVPYNHSWSYWGTLYGAVAGNIAIVDDIKIYDGPIPDGATWVSLDDWSWKAEAGQHIRHLFRT